MIELEVSAPQYEIMTSLASRNLFLAGAGSGKTFTIGVIAIDFVLNYPAAIGLIAANTYSQLTKSTIKGVCECWKNKFNLINGVHYVIDKIPPANFKRIGEPLKSYENTISFINGALIFIASLDNYKVLDGMELGYALLDETKDTKEEAVKEVIEWRLRQKCMYLLGDTIYDYPIHGSEGYNPLFVFTSPAKVAWLNEHFRLSNKYDQISQKIFSETDFYTHEEDGTKVVISSTFHNKHNLPSGFIEKKLKDFKGDKNKIDMLIYGSPVAKTGGELFPDFTRDKHISSDVDVFDNIPLHITFDFNVIPYITSLIIQINNINDIYYIDVCDEVCEKPPKANTEYLCNKIVGIYLRKNDAVFFYGDASGKKQDTSSLHHNYEHIERIFKPYINDNSNRVLRRNPNVVASRAFVNKIFADGFDDIKIRISPRCVNLIKDLEFLKMAPDGGKLKEYSVDEVTGKKFEKYGHTSDALTYFIISAFHQHYE